MSHPFFNQVFTFTQPNGDTLPVRGWGDQYHARFETLDGYTVARNPVSGYYEVARRAADGIRLESSGLLPGNKALDTAGIAQGLRLDVATARLLASASPLTGKTRWQQRNEQARLALRASLKAVGPPPGPQPAPPQRHTVGTFVGLCVPVQFPDVAAAVSAAEISEFCNKPGYNGFGNNGSVRDYFLDNSIGRCDYTTIVAPVYTARRRRSYYTDPAERYGARAQELIHEALAYHQGNGFDFTPLTSDPSKFIYAINVLYAGEVTNNWSEGLWPHAHFLAHPVRLALGKMAHDYQITALGSELRLGTYCHENGHMLCDYPDLYDYDGDSAGVGEFCLMCAGNHADQRNPVQVGAYLKYRAGWARSVTELTSGLKAAAPAAGNHFYLLRKNAAEYLIVENRAKTGRDAALPGAGLAIWHIDELGNNRYQQDDPNLHYECALIQADGRKDLERNLNQGDTGDLYGPGATFSGTWWDKQPIGISLGKISAPGPSVQFETF